MTTQTTHRTALAADARAAARAIIRLAAQIVFYGTIALAILYIPTVPAVGIPAGVLLFLVWLLAERKDRR